MTNPLSVARGRLELARETGDEQHLDRIEAAHDRIEDLVEDLVTLARTGEHIDELTGVDLSEMANTAWTTVETEDATLEIDNTITIKADSSRLCQLLENLFANAVTHGGSQRWNALRTAISREIGDFSYIWVREEQESGLPHLHLLVSRFLPQDWLSTRWDELGGGEIVDIRMIEHTDKADHYIGKYLTKDALSGLPDGIRRYGSSSDIDLEVRDSSPSSDDWDLLMDDYEVTTVDGDEPITRPPTGADFIQQRRNGGPPDRPPND